MYFSRVSTATGIQRTVQTDGAGYYLFPSLPVGKYTADASNPGFDTAEQDGGGSPGAITSLASDPRIMQFALRLRF